jgi:hypothetical protein
VKRNNSICSEVGNYQILNKHCAGAQAKARERYTVPDQTLYTVNKINKGVKQKEEAKEKAGN